NLKLALRRQPYEILTANSGSAALGLLRKRPVDLVVSDERMPGMSGSELLTHVAREFPDTIRIILSGQASLESAIRAINDARIFRFLTKPCSPEDLTECLQAALAAKKRHTETQPPAEGDRTLSEDFDRALASLWMAFQPVVRPALHQVFAFEALVRSYEPALSNPAALFDAAKRLDRTHVLEDRIRDQVGEVARRLPLGTSLLVNLHPDSFNDPEFFSSDNPLLPHAERIVLEVTERAPLEAVAGLRQKVKALRSFGFRLALDDLGAGHAGLSSLALLQPEIVKFDMGLVRNVQRSRTKRKLIASMVDLGRELGFETIAEGVETIEEYAALRETGCRLFQGYLLAMPGKAFPDVAWPEENGR
ncbi:MAG: EAL domain-containing protein, partial [Proteobacteria bacterium]|nr:EAL domain-containing protein [Pseudomonadota bacterium]